MSALPLSRSSPQLSRFSSLLSSPLFGCNTAADGRRGKGSGKGQGRKGKGKGGQVHRQVRPAKSRVAVVLPAPIYIYIYTYKEEAEERHNNHPKMGDRRLPLQQRSRWAPTMGASCFF